MSRRLQCCLMLSALVATGCRTTGQPGGSDVKFGFLQSSASQLIFKPSGSTIGVCGAFFADVQWAIGTWAQPIGRTYNVVQDCQHQTINVFSAQDPFAVSECKAASLVGRGFSRPNQSPMMIVDCGGLNRAGILHEIGHTFGLCDQYPGEVEKCASTTAIVPGSVMNAATSEQLTADDIAGIRALAAAAGTPAVGPTGPAATFAGGLYASSDSAGNKCTVRVDTASITINCGNDTAIYSACNGNRCFLNGDATSAFFVEVTSTESFVIHIAGKALAFALAQPAVVPPPQATGGRILHFKLDGRATTATAASVTAGLKAAGRCDACTLSVVRSGDGFDVTTDDRGLATLMSLFTANQLPFILFDPSVVK